MNSIDLIHLQTLMERTSGSSETKIGLIDGPVLLNHPLLNNNNIIELPGNITGNCLNADSVACGHGTFVAGMLKSKRGSGAPAICPECTLLIRPVFSEVNPVSNNMPGATPLELASAIEECIHSGARIINLSLALKYTSMHAVHVLEEALRKALTYGVIVVAAAGNQNNLGSSVITRHQWVIPVIGCNASGHPMNESNLGISTGRKGLSAPGNNITSLSSEGKLITLSGTSVAAPFVTGAIALLWSLFPNATATQIKLAITQTTSLRRTSVMPPLLNANLAYQTLLQTNVKRHVA